MSLTTLHSYALLLTAAVLLAITCQADTVILRDGTIREGRILNEDDHSITIEVKFGSLLGKVRIQRSEIASIKRKALKADPVSVEAQKLQAVAEAQIGKGAQEAEAWVKLGDYYASKEGFSSKAKDAYKRALTAEPEHAAAHGRLGHVKTKNGWQALDDERRARGLVPLDKVWVKPEERAWLIDRKHQQDTDDLRIGPRKDDAFARKDIEQQLKIKQAEVEYQRREQLRLQNGESLLSRYGYYLPSGNGWYIGSGETPYYAEGVGLSSGDSEFFVGRIGSGKPYYRYRDYPLVGGQGTSHPTNYSHSRHTHRNGFSPGVVYRNNNFSLGFGTNFGGYGYRGYRGYGYGNSGYGYGSGFGFNIRGGSGNFNYNLNFGGFSRRSSRSSYSGF